MKWVLIVGAGLAAAALLAVLVGLALPKTHSASRQSTLSAPPDAVWRTITDVDAFPGWRSDVTRVERLPPREGQAVWIEETSSGRITLAVERSEPPRLLVLRVADKDLPFGGKWTYELTPVPGGTRLTITEDGEIYNPVFRLMARFVFGYEGTIVTYLTALERRLGS
jgi:uncharacterized protein YndB with AHSA1/START domain